MQKLKSKGLVFFCLLAGLMPVCAQEPLVTAFGYHEQRILDGWKMAGAGEISIAKGETMDGESDALSLNYDFRSAIDTQFRRYWEEPIDLRDATGLHLKVRGDGSGQMLRLALIVGEPGVDTHVFGRRVPLYMDYEGWREYFLPWEDFYLVEEHRHGISVLVLMMDYLNTKGPQQGSILVDDVAFTDQEPRESGFVELKSDADFFEEIDLALPALKPVAKAVSEKDWPAARVALVSYMRQRKAPVHFLRSDEIASVIKLYDQHYGDGELTKPARSERWEKWSNNEIDYINLKIEGPLRWDNYPGQHPLTLAVLHRQGWVPGLAQAYQITGEDRYAEKVIETIRTFNEWRMGCEILGYQEIEPRTSWGWPRDIDVAHRAQNWLRAYPYIKDHPSFTTDIQFEMFKALFHHAQWLYASNIPGFESWNHQIFRAIGQVEIGILMPEFKRAGAWREQGLDILQQHLDRETLEDGAYFELTPGYGGGVANAMMLLVHLARMNESPLPEGFADRTFAMVDWFAGQVAPNGSLPATGDVWFGYRAGKVLATGACIETRGDWKFLSGYGKLDDEYFWFIGPKTLKAYQELASEHPAWTARYLSSGFLTLRSGWNPDSHFGFLNASVEGGGHAHTDSLNVDLHAYGVPILGDPGINGFTNPDFPFFDSTRAHSLLQIDRQEVPTIDPVVTRWESDSDTPTAAALITYPDGTTHERTLIQLPEGVWRIEDRIEFPNTSEAPRLIEQIWRAAPDVEVSIEEGAAMLTHSSGKGYVLITENENITVSTDELRPDIASISEAAVFTVETHGKTLRITTIATPFRATDD